MATSTQPAKPVDLLREQITTLEASITLAVDHPGKRTVHLLRTSTRRIEAQLALIRLVAKSSATRHQRKSTRLLAELRRAAGAVRDLDVARDLLKEPGALQTGATQEGDPETLAETARLHRRLARDARFLRKALRRQRARAARDLVTLLEHHGPLLAHTLESLLASLAIPDETSTLTISPSRLATLTEDWVHSQLPAAPAPDASPKTLHGIRKVAKLARYMAESTPATASLAQTFERLQAFGGTWHDYLHLHGLARAELGKRSPLTKLLSRLTASSLTTFQAKLAKTPASGS